jgi:hypothetical protein
VALSSSGISWRLQPSATVQISTSPLTEVDASKVSSQENATPEIGARWPRSTWRALSRPRSQTWMSPPRVPAATTLPCADQARLQTSSSMAT